MAHYAFLNENNVVTEVITGRDEWEEIDGITDWEQAYSEIRNQVCKRTSYNGNIRFNFAGVGYSYDPIDDAFIAPMPECGHDDLLLNDLKRWECDTCAAEIQQRMAGV
jgi:hypothetical protein